MERGITMEKRYGWAITYDNGITEHSVYPMTQDQAAAQLGKTLDYHFVHGNRVNVVNVRVLMVQ